MTQIAPPSWSRVKAVLADALDMPAEQRGTFLDGACAGQPGLRARVEDLVRAYSTSGELNQDDSPALRPTMLEPRPGERLGRYRIVRLIGRGGMGAVYEAVDEQLGRPVAVKLLGSGVASLSMLRRFELEPRLLARLRHPGIAQIFDAGSITGPGGEPLPFFAMELVADAMPINGYAQRHALSAPDRIGLFVRVCEAVTHGHQHSVIHRDLKPANILVDGGGHPKIIDFGVAHAADPQGADATITGEVLGTLWYMSPEQLSGTGDGVDVRTDVYALGVVLYELLCGKPPRPDSHDLAASIREAGVRPPLPLSSLAPELHGDLETVALKAVEPDRAVRYQSVTELSADLGRVLRNEPISARPHSAAYQIRMFTRRHRALVGGLVAIFAALTLGVIGTSVGLVRAWAAEQRAVAQARRSQRITAFLQNSIRSADPQILPPETIAALGAGVLPWESWFLPSAGWGSAGPADVGVAGVLRHAAEHLDSEFADDPEVRAEVSVLLAYTLAGLEDTQTAARLLDSALKIQLSLLDPDDEAVIRTRALYARTLMAMHQWLEADVQLRLAKDSASRRLGPLDSRTLVLADLTAINLVPMGRGDDGSAMARGTIGAVALARGADSVDAWLRRVTLIDVLKGRMLVEERAELIGECRAAMDGLARALGPDAHPIAHVAECLASELSHDPASLAEAESVQRRAIAINAKACGPDSSAVYDGRTALCSILMRQRKLGEAEAVTRQSFESAVHMIGPQSRYSYKAAGRLARILTWRGIGTEETERLARQAAEGSAAVAKVDPTEGDFACYHRAIWAAAIRLRGRAGEAEAMLREGIAIHGGRSPTHPGAWVEAYLYLQLALCLEDLGRAGEAAAAIGAAREWGLQLNDPDHPVLLNIEDVRARLEARGTEPTAH